MGPRPQGWFKNKWSTETLFVQTNFKGPYKRAGKVRDKPRPRSNIPAESNWRRSGDASLGAEEDVGAGLVSRCLAFVWTIIMYSVCLKDAAISQAGPKGTNKLNSQLINKENTFSVLNTTLHPNLKPANGTADSSRDYQPYSFFSFSPSAPFSSGIKSEGFLRL